MKASGPISDIECDIRRFLSAMVSTPSGAWPLPHPRSRRACNSQPALRLVDAGDAEDEDCIGTAALQHKGAPSTADRCKLQSVLGLQYALSTWQPCWLHAFAQHLCAAASTTDRHAACASGCAESTDLASLRPVSRQLQLETTEASDWSAFPLRLLQWH